MCQMFVQTDTHHKVRIDQACESLQCLLRNADLWSKLVHYYLENLNVSPLQVNNIMRVAHA